MLTFVQVQDFVCFLYKTFKVPCYVKKKFSDLFFCVADRSRRLICSQNVSGLKSLSTASGRGSVQKSSVLLHLLLRGKMCCPPLLNPPLLTVSSGSLLPTSNRQTNLQSQPWPSAPRPPLISCRMTTVSKSTTTRWRTIKSSTMKWLMTC